ncbi:MAG: sigma 54-interacting transcriptional regulator [Holophaga sp.]|nr:sigma 54-interacting transcriptional regulator [Holophaga sp.]
MTPHLLSLQDPSLIQQKAMQSMFDCFESLCEGTVMVDKAANVVWINDRYAARLGIEPRLAIGQEIEAIIPNSLMRQVVTTGEPILLDLLEASSQTFVVMRMPVRDEDGEVLGAVGFALFSHMEALKPLFGRFSSLQTELVQVQKKLAEARRTKYTFSSFIGNSPATMEVKRLARRAAMLNAPVLLQGETGTGNELLAHAIHAGGPRSAQPFVTVNVAAVPENLLEAEFFGVAPGAYTGADRKARPGKFELANGGTLFLDEIGDMPLNLQSKLLRVLQDQEFEPLGSNRVIRVDVRIIAATSRDLETMAEDGHFRKDLFYRLNVLNIPVPPLRQRPGDLELLCEHLLEATGLQSGVPARELSPEAMEVLRRHTWPGNVRELHNVLERAVMNSDEHRLEVADFHGLEKAAARPVPDLPEVPAGSSYAETMARAERRILEAALSACSGKVADAARRLGIGRATFYKRMTALQRLSPKSDTSPAGDGYRKGLPR